ncbi:MAG: hypothetical protein ACI9OJ_005358 [Myxococcota bacterium]
MSALLGFAYVIAAWIWVLVLPGYLASRVLLPNATGLWRWTLSLFCGWSTVPLVLFLATVAAGVPMDLPFLLLSSTLINGLGFAVLMPWKAPSVGLRDTAIVAGALMFAALFIMFGIRSLDGGDVFSTVHHCLYVIVMYTIGNDPSASIPMFDAASGDVIHYLVSHPTTQFNGIAPLFFEQRLGNAPIVAPYVALFGTFGWFWATATTALLSGLLTYEGGRTLGAGPLASAIAAILFTCGMQVFCGYFVNENTYAVVLVTFLIVGALKDDRSWPFLALLGWSAGHLIGVRYTSALFLPAVAVAALWPRQSVSRGDMLRQFAFGASFVVLATLPWLYVNYVMLGDPLTHPKIHPEHEGRVVMNTLFGIEFQFRALNWPFTEQLVRTPWNPFPTFLWLPLRIADVFGQIAVALSCVGLVALWRRKNLGRRAAILLLIFGLPHTLCMMWLETLDWEQLTYSAPGLVPLGLLLAVGIDWLVASKPQLPKRAVITAGVTATIVGLSFGVRAIELPADTRMLDPETWPTPPPTTAATDSVAKRLTGLSLLPRLPKFRTSVARDLSAALGSLPASGVPSTGERPLYPSGQIAVLAGYSQDMATAYSFSVAPREPLVPGGLVRSSLGLHQLSLLLAAERIDVEITRRRGAYAIDITPVGSGPERDFTVWLHPWMPAIEAINVTIAGQPISGLRTLTYGGLMEEEQVRFIVTNYPSQVLDTIEVSYQIENAGDVRCGLFLFLNRVDPSDIETLVLAGGHDTFWMGEPTGTLSIPKHLASDKIVLYVDPYCTTHVPQYGDTWAVAEGPFTADKPLIFKLDQRW